MAVDRDPSVGVECDVNDDTLFLRQVHPNFIQDGIITSQAFRPTPNDLGKLSCYDRDQITPEKSWEHYTQVLRRDSAGVVAVTVLECLRVCTQAYVDGVGYPEHAVIDYSNLSSNSKVRDASKRLARKARFRGWLHGPIT